jgi:hypothetical protein
MAKPQSPKRGGPSNCDDRNILVSAVRLANDSGEMSPLRVSNAMVSATWRSWVFAIVAIASALSLSSCSKPPARPPPPNEPPATNVSPGLSTAAVTNTVFEKLLSGYWVRPDGGYVLEVRVAKADGSLEAYYFNPRPINVSRAEWQRADDGLHVFIELRDQNYPGATYKLRYLPQEDQLAGEYYQPVYQQTFEVQFIRQNR